MSCCPLCHGFGTIYGTAPKRSEYHGAHQPLLPCPLCTHPLEGQTLKLAQPETLDWWLGEMELIAD